MSMMPIGPRLFGLGLALALLCCVARSQTAANPASLPFRRAVDAIATQALAATGTSSASLAIVLDGKVAYVHAYGAARLEPRVDATPAMRYSLGSVSKQFTAAAILKLQEQGKLSLDDPVSRFLPSLTSASQITLRELLSHTSGYRDYWPQDYVPPFMLAPLTPEQLLAQWATRPLDFEPGTRWQYSNTNFVAAALIVEKVSGIPLMEFLRENIFAPAGMKEVADVDDGPLGEKDAAGYLRYGIGPPHKAPKEAKGWLFGAGELAMTAQDLATWDASMIGQRVLKPSSYRAMQTETLLKNGSGTQYGLGIGVKSVSGHRALEHGGEVSGYSAENLVFPDDRVAIAVLTNQDMSNAPAAIANKIASLLIPEDAATRDRELGRVRSIFEGLQMGRIDRQQFTANGNSYFTAQALRDFASTLAPLGRPLAFEPSGEQERGGMTYRSYTVKSSRGTLDVWVRELADGKIEQYQIAAEF
ncbi:MAG: serine hydrolase domain-containing protein [Terracidiphilus sp.]